MKLAKVVHSQLVNCVCVERNAHKCVEKGMCQISTRSSRLPLDAALDDSSMLSQPDQPARPSNPFPFPPTSVTRQADTDEGACSFALPRPPRIKMINLQTD